MKKFVGAVAISLLFWPVFGSSPYAARQNDNKAVESTPKEKQIYQDKIAAKLRELDQQIDALKARMRKQNTEDRKQYEKEIAELDRKRAAAHQELDKLRISSQEAWQDLKAGVDTAIDNLEAAYKQAASHFK